MKNFTIISDPGIDDIISLVLLYKLYPELQNTLVATFGNASENITSLNAKEFISFIVPKWQYMHGSTLPLNGQIERPWPDYFHGSDGVWGVHPNITNHDIQTTNEYPKNNEIISLAPMHDTLNILQMNLGKNFTIMGGAFTIEGNETKFAETNIAFDVEAAEVFFSHCQNIQVRIVPLDVTRKVYWDISMVQNISESSEINQWLKKLLLTWFQRYTHEREKNFNLHDPLAVYLHFFPEQAVWKTSGVKVITEGEERGRTIFSQTNPNCEIAYNLMNPDTIIEKIYNIVFN